MKDDSITNRPTIAISFKEFRDEEIVDFFANEHRSFHPEHSVSGKDSRSRVVGTPHFSCKRKPTAAFRSSLGIHEEPNIGREDDTILIRVSDDLSGDEPIIRVARGRTSKAVPKEPRKKTIETAFGKATKPLGAVVFGRSYGPQENERAARVVSDPLENREKTTDPRRKIGVQLRPFPIAGRCVPLTTQVDTNQVDTDRVDIDRVDIDRVDTTQVVDANQADASQAGVDQCLQRLIESWDKLPPHMKETIAALVEVSESVESGKWKVECEFE